VVTYFYLLLSMGSSNDNVHSYIIISVGSRHPISFAVDKRCYCSVQQTQDTVVSDHSLWLSLTLLSSDLLVSPAVYAEHLFAFTCTKFCIFHCAGCLMINFYSFIFDFSHITET